MQSRDLLPDQGLGPRSPSITAQRVVLLYLAAEDYALFEQIALKYGASREGCGLAGKEQAVIALMAELGKLTALK